MSPNVVIKFPAMPSDLTPTAETEMIKAYVRLLAPDIHEVSCGTRVEGGYELWLQLSPTSTIKPVIVSQVEYATEQWKDKVGAAIEEVNT